MADSGSSRLELRTPSGDMSASVVAVRLQHNGSQMFHPVGS